MKWIAVHVDPEENTGNSFAASDPAGISPLAMMNRAL